MNNLQVVALDLSLSSTGYATSSPRVRTGTVSVPTRGVERMRDITRHLFDHARTAHLVVVEGPSYGSGTAGRQSGHHERAGLWWHLAYRLWEADIPTAVVPPASLKKYAAGKGNASKDVVMLAAARRYPDVSFHTNDEADALVMLAMALDHLGHALAVVPGQHRAALDGVTWPEVAV